MRVGRRIGTASRAAAWIRRSSCIVRRAWILWLVVASGSLSSVEAPGRAADPPLVVRGKSSIVLRAGESAGGGIDRRPEFALNVPAFDSRNRPYIRSRGDGRHSTGFVHTLRDGRWVKLDLLRSVRAAFPDLACTELAGGWLDSRIVFDRDDHAYTLLRIVLRDGSRRHLRLYSRDLCETWTCYVLAMGRGTEERPMTPAPLAGPYYPLPWGAFALEHPDGPEPLEEPPIVALWWSRARHPARWAERHVLRIVAPRKIERGLELGGPVEVSRDFIGYVQHSGGATAFVTRNGRTHLVWGEVSDRELPGVPIFAATFDRRTGRLGEKVLLAHAPPPNDVHCAPGICMDRDGYLHVLTGAHGDAFRYLRSLKPEDVSGGWSRPVPVLVAGWRHRPGEPERGRQTYLALVRDCEDTLHVVCRQWRRFVDEYHVPRPYRALSYLRKRGDGPWEEAWPLVIPPFSEYSIYHHHLSVDRDGRLYLSYSPWCRDAPDADDAARYASRALILSDDGGESWHPASTELFLAAIKR